MPSAKRSSPRREKTGSRSCSSRGRSARVQRELSCPASEAIVSQRSAVELGNGLNRAVDLLVAVGERDEHCLELARRDVDPALEQMAEKCRVTLHVCTLGVVEVADWVVGHEEGRHGANALHSSVHCEACFETRAALLELLVDDGIAKPAQDRKARGRGERVPRQGPRL